MTDVIRETHCPHCGATTQITEDDLDWAAEEVAKGEAVAERNTLSAKQEQYGDVLKTKRDLVDALLDDDHLRWFGMRQFVESIQVSLDPLRGGVCIALNCDPHLMELDCTFKVDSLRGRVREAISDGLTRAERDAFAAEMRELADEIANADFYDKDEK